MDKRDLKEGQEVYVKGRVIRTGDHLDIVLDEGSFIENAIILHHEKPVIPQKERRERMGNLLRYRAWLPTLQRMCEVTVIDYDLKSVDICMVGDVEHYTEMTVSKDEVILMQSTGIFGKNDTEIFEGDVVRFSHLSGYPFNGFLNRVTWDKHNAAFKLVPLDKTWSDTYFSNFEGDALKSLEVIGNVCEKDKLEEGINDPK